MRRSRSAAPERSAASRSASRLHWLQSMGPSRSTWAKAGPDAAYACMSSVSETNGQTGTKVYSGRRGLDARTSSRAASRGRSLCSYGRVRPVDRADPGAALRVVHGDHGHAGVAGSWSDEPTRRHRDVREWHESGRDEPGDVA